MTSEYYINQTNFTSVVTYIEDTGDSNSCTQTLKDIFTYVEMPIAVIGVIGNVISALVFGLERRKYSSHTLLIALAVVDGLLLVFNEWLQLLNWYMTSDLQCGVQTLILRVLHPSVHILHCANIWLTLLIAVNRFIAICRPFSVSFWCTKRKTYAMLIGMLIVAVLYNVPRFFEYRVNRTQELQTDGSYIENCEYAEMPLHHSLVYNGLMYFTFITIGPMIIIAALYCKIIQDLKQQSQQQVDNRDFIPSALRTTEERQATNSILAIITVFIVVQSLVTISRIMQTFNVTACGVPRYFHAFVDVMVVFNSSVNFVLYCAIRKTFRKRLQYLCYKSKPTFYTIESAL